MTHRSRVGAFACFMLLPVVARAQSGPDDPACEPPQPARTAVLTNRVRIASTGEPGERMRIVLRFADERGAPHAGMMVYAYHTNAQGHYPVGAGAVGCYRWHGALHAFAQTGRDGTVIFETIRPGPYPGRTDPQHVHVVVQFPEVRGFYLNALVFSDDPRVTPAYRASERDAGSTGISTAQRDSAGTWQVNHTFRLPRPRR